MGISTILSESSIELGVRAHCKREILEALTAKAADLTGESANDIFDILMERERLGSTGLGDGVAIPHGKIENLSQVTGVFIRLEEPVNFDALDGNPVDLVFLLLAPANATAAHLKALARVARLLRDPEIRDALREAETAETVFAIVTHEHKSNAA